jgi:PAS domain S-box-containing protein
MERPREKCARFRVCLQWMKDPVRSAFLFAVLLAAVIVPYWWLVVQWSAMYFTDPELRFTFITTTFLLVLIIADSVFLVRYYQVVRRREYEQQALELRESEEKYRMIIEDMQDMFYRTDLEGRITMISPAGVKLAGYASLDEMIGLNAQDMYVDPDERERLLFAVAETGEITGYPLQLRRRDGSIRFVTTSSHFIHDAQGAVVGLEGIIHDITDLRQAEDALSIANKKLNLLSSITRHDIRNQLTALKTYLVLNEEAINEPAELAGYFEKEMQIADVIDRHISFTRDYEDLGVKAPSWQNVDAVVKIAMALLPMRDIRVTLDRSDLEVNADVLFGKVFYNLLDNALRYGGTKMSAISISSCAGPAGSLVVTFEDNGDGIDTDAKAHIFSKGFGKNTGLGLFLSQEILSITGITITETGIFGKGARFEMTVPEGCYRYTAAPAAPS